MTELTQKLMADPASTEERVLALLAALSEAIFACIREREDSEEFAEKVVGMVRWSTL